MSYGTVLIVEDEPEVAEVLEFNLQSAGFETLIAADGLTACRLVGGRAPDLILLDVLLPDLTGWEICRMIRGLDDPVLASIPIVMLTALGTTQDKLRGLETGADDYLPKPFSVREVVLKAGKLIGRRRSAEETARHLREVERERRTDQDLQGLLFHELHNKLVVIRGFSNRLTAADEPEERRLRYAQVVQDSAQYLNHLAEQVLTLAGVENGGVELPVEVVDLDSVLCAVAGLHRESAAEKGIDLRLESSRAGRTAQGNALALRVCLSNLVENAIRYSPAGSTIAVSSTAADNLLCLDVDDEGPGVPEGDRQRVFERFYRGQGGQQVHGTGLGLYMVRTLARAMGGEATLSGRVGGGTRARLCVPAGALPVAAPLLEDAG